MHYDREFYYKQGKDFGYGGLALPDYWLPENSGGWQGLAFREGHKVGMILRAADEKKKAEKKG